MTPARKKALKSELILTRELLLHNRRELALLHIDGPGVAALLAQQIGLEDHLRNIEANQ